jgi:hypothetical protein
MTPRAEPARSRSSTAPPCSSAHARFSRAGIPAADPVFRHARRPRWSDSTVHPPSLRRRPEQLVREVPSLALAASDDRLLETVPSFVPAWVDVHVGASRMVYPRRATECPVEANRGRSGRAPCAAEANLGALEDEELEQAPVVVHGHAPLLVVLRDVEPGGPRPLAPHLARRHRERR